MGALRTKKQDKKYETFKSLGGLDNGCKLCKLKSLKTFDHWTIIKNKFPYDRIAAVHHMIVSNRHVTEPKLSRDEIRELLKIKKGYINDRYEFMIEQTQKIKSIPEHFHLHLIIAKK